MKAPSLHRPSFGPIRVRPYPWAKDGWDQQPGARFRIGRQLVEDPGYAALWRQTKDLLALERAGFFDDCLTPSQRRELGMARDVPARVWERLESPLPAAFDLEGLPPDKPWVVLLTTGGFAPFHSGHLAMLEAAESEAVARGWPVLATIVSPSHDAYVSLSLIHI